MKIEWGKFKLEFSLDMDDILLLIGICTVAFVLTVPISCGIYQELHPERFRIIPMSSTHSESTVIQHGQR